MIFDEASTASPFLSSRATSAANLLLSSRARAASRGTCFSSGVRRLVFFPCLGAGSSSSLGVVSPGISFSMEFVSVPGGWSRQEEFTNRSAVNSGPSLARTFSFCNSSLYRPWFRNSVIENPTSTESSTIQTCGKYVRKRNSSGKGFEVGALCHTHVGHSFFCDLPQAKDAMLAIKLDVIRPQNDGQIA